MENDYPHLDFKNVTDSFLEGDKQGIKHYFNYLVDHKRSAIQIKQDGTIIITPPSPPSPPPSSSSSSSSSSNTKTNDGRFPTEILTLILSQLHDEDDDPALLTTTLFECTLVSKHFHFVANPLLWKKITLDNHIIAERFLNCILQYYQHQKQQHQHEIRHLKLANDFWTDTTFSILIPHLQSLTHLEISNLGDMETPDPLEYLPMHCRHLEQLKLDQITLSSDFFVALGHHCHQLTHLTLLDCVDIPSDLLTWLTACPLTSLTLCSDDYGNDILSGTSIRRLKTHFDTLTTLDIEGVEGSPIRLILDATLTTTTATTATVWPQLTTLRLTPCIDVDDDLLNLFLQSHPQLMHLTLIDAALLTSASLDGISTYLRQLTTLTLDGVEHLTSAAVRYWLRTTTTTGMSLTSVAFNFCPNVSPKDFPESLTQQKNSIVLDRLALDKIRQSPPPSLLATTTISNHHMD